LELLLIFFLGYLRLSAKRGGAVAATADEWLWEVASDRVPSDLRTVAINLPH